MVRRETRKMKQKTRKVKYSISMFIHIAGIGTVKILSQIDRGGLGPALL